MTSKIDDQFIRQDGILSEQDEILIQTLILEEIQRKPVISSLDDIYLAVRYRLSYSEKIKNRIVEMIKLILHKTRPAVEGSKESRSEPGMPKHQKGEKCRNEIVAASQLVAYDTERMLALQEASEKKEIEQALLLSKKHLDVHMDLEKQFQETLAKSYQEEKRKLLTILTAQDFDFNILANQLNKVLPEETTITYKGTSLKHRSVSILAMIQLFDHDYTILSAAPIQDHIRSIHQLCLSIGSCVTYQKGTHQKNPSSTFNISSINDYLVNIEIRGDGNCMWSSISHSLVGDYAMMESLRLLTANVLMQFSDKFSEILMRQTSKFGYNALTLQQLIKTSVSLQSWGDEFHLIALSLALKRPIYSYGSLIDIPESTVMGYEQFRLGYETESFPNHFKFIGDANDSNNEPILLHYDGHSHYSCVLKRSACVKPLVPFIQIIDALFNGGNVTSEPENLIDIDSSMTEIVANVAANQRDYLTDDDDDDDDCAQTDEIAQLKKDLSDKTKLLQFYDTFFQEIKMMLNSQKLDLRQLQDFVDKVENNRQ